MTLYSTKVFASCIIFCLCLKASEGLKYNRCFKCRSRGELGSCKDPFVYTNTTAVEHVAGVEMQPCSSGWCRKVLEGGANTFKDEEYGIATERSCLVRGPSDSEERCAPTLMGNTKVMMCFCHGDLCNAAPSINGFWAHSVLLLSISIVLINFR